MTAAKLIKLHVTTPCDQDFFVHLLGCQEVVGVEHSHPYPQLSAEATSITPCAGGTGPLSTVLCTFLQGQDEESLKRVT